MRLTYDGLSGDKRAEGECVVAVFAVFLRRFPSLTAPLLPLPAEAKRLELLRGLAGVRANFFDSSDVYWDRVVTDGQILSATEGEQVSKKFKCVLQD